MPLLKESQRRYLHILHEFMLYATDYFRARDLDVFGHELGGVSTIKGVGEIIEAVWGEGGHLEVIDAFLQDPCVKLDQSDEKVVASWREGILDDFIVFRSGSDTVFFYGDYAFSVLGAENVLDSQEECPCKLRAIIVPFEDHITCLAFLAAYPNAFVGTQASLMDDLRRARERGVLIRSGREFERVSSEAREAYRGGRKNPWFLDEEVRRSKEETPYGCHVSELAGLSWEERKRRLYELRIVEIDGLPEDDVAMVFDAYSLEGLPP